MRTLLGDGNFKQDHLTMKDDFDNVSLSDSLGYMVDKYWFEAYMKGFSALQENHKTTSKKSDTQSAITIMRYHSRTTLRLT